MKKSIFISNLALISLVSLFSCKTQEAINSENNPHINRCETLDAPIKLDFYATGKYDSKTFFDIANYEDMAIVLTQPTCSHCKDFFKYLPNYIASTHAIIYEVNVYDYTMLFDKGTEGFDKYKIQSLYDSVGTPSMAFIKDKEVLKIESAPSDNQTNVNNFINNNIFLTNYYSLNTYTKERTDIGQTAEHDVYRQDFDASLGILGRSTTYLKEKIDISSSLTVLFTWRRCSDCKNLIENVIDDYFLTDANKNADKVSSKKLYYFELDGFMQKKRSTDDNVKYEGTKEWYDFNKEFSFSYLPTYNENINEYTSVTPTIINYPSKENAVFLNHLGVKTNSDNTLSFEYAFYDEVKELKTTKTVSYSIVDGVETVDDAEAKMELNTVIYNKASEIEKKKVIDFLNRHI